GGSGLPPARHPGKLKEGGARRSDSEGGSRMETSATVGAPRGGHPLAKGMTGASQAPPMRRDTHGDLPRVRLLALHPPLEGRRNEQSSGASRRENEFRCLEQRAV